MELRKKLVFHTDTARLVWITTTILVQNRVGQGENLQWEMGNHVATGFIKLFLLFLCVDVSWRGSCQGCLYLSKWIQNSGNWVPKRFEQDFPNSCNCVNKQRGINDIVPLTSANSASSSCLRLSSSRTSPATTWSGSPQRMHQMTTSTADAGLLELFSEPELQKQWQTSFIWPKAEVHRADVENSG